MKVCLQNTDIANTGKGFFFERLAAALRNIGVQIVSNLNHAHDISLQIARLKKTNTKRYVLRLDGVWHNTAMDYIAENKPIKEALSRADGVVYQSFFSKKICDAYLKTSVEKSVVIPNGMCLDSTFDKREKKHKFVFVTAARWRPQKRLSDIINSFILADVEDSILYVAGDVSKSGLSELDLKKLFNHPKIEYTGTVDQKTLLSYLKIADGFLHLSWIDFCPNSVVEAIAAKVPVITNNIGGTKELVEPSGGLVLPLDDEYDLEPCKLYEPPKIDHTIVAEAIWKCCDNKIRITNAHVDINLIARKYKEFFEKCLM